MSPADAARVLDDFRRDGYTIVRGLVPHDTLDSIAREISGVLVRRAHSLDIPIGDGSGRADLTAQLVALFESDPTNYMAAAKLTQHLVAVHQLGVGAEILSVVAALGLSDPAISTRPVIHYMADKLRISGGYHKTPAHQDWRSVQGSLDGITIWLPLFDVTERDYPLEVVPASHRRGLLPSAEHAFGHCVAEGYVDDSEFVTVPVARGDAIFFSGFLVHRTGTEGGDLARIALSYRFNNAAEPTFVERNYTDRYLYRAQNDLVFPDFPRSADIEGTFPVPRA
jgi:phytanoyl-CoA hydroxylase